MMSKSFVGFRLNRGRNMFDMLEAALLNSTCGAFQTKVEASQAELIKSLQKLCAATPLAAWGSQVYIFRSN